jgi:peptide/nickel transport system substrate-binding protein
MRSTKRLIAIAASLAILAGVGGPGAAFAQTASSSASSSASSRSKSTFIFADTSPIDSLNPMVGYNASDFYTWVMNYDLPINYSLSDLGPDYAHSIVPQAPVVSPDNMTFTYTIRPNMKWSDGQPFTASDIAWTLNYYKKNNIPNYSSDLTLFSSADAPDATHFVVHTSAPTSLFSGGTVWMYEFILPQHIWSKMKDPQKAPGWPAVGSGPYYISNYQQDKGLVTLTRNPYYWGNTVAGMQPHYQTIIYEVFKDSNAEATALQTGAIDFAFLDSGNIVNAMKNKPNIVTRGANLGDQLFEELGFNTGSGFQTDPTGGFVKHGDGIHAASDPAFRRAIREAVDDQTIVDKVLLGYGTPGISPVTPTETTGNWQPPPDQALPFNLDKAKSDLAAAGYVDTDGDGIVNDPVTHQDVILRYYVRTSGENSQNTAPYVASWLKQIGVGTKIKNMSDEALTSAIMAGDYDMFDWDWYSGPDPAGILNVFTCAERDPNPKVYRNSDSYFCDTTFDTLYHQQFRATDATKRADMIHQMQGILYQDEPYVVLYNAQTLEAYRSDRVTGLVSQPSDNGDLLATLGPLGFISIQPATGAAAAASSGSISAGVWILIAALIAVVVVAIVLLSRRRRSAEDAA